MKIKLPEFSLVLLIGPSGSGKSSFARKHFKETEILSSDFYRGLVSDDENDQNATGDAFEVLHYILRKRLSNKKLCVIDATNVRPEDRKPLIKIAKEYHALSVAIVLKLPEKLCHERNKVRPNRTFGEHVIRRQSQGIKRSLRGLSREGIRFVHILSSEAEVDSVEIARQRLWVDKTDEPGPFDIIGDVHGCCDELEELLTALGYSEDGHNGWSHPESRKAVFLGDLVDRGPRVGDTLRLVMKMTATDNAICVPGNHDVKFLKFLNGRNVQLKHGLEKSVEQFEDESDEFKAEVKTFLDGLISHYVLDSEKLVVAHAGMREDYQGRASGKVRQFALFGETTGEIDEFGLPVRYPWVSEYRGRSMVVYGHTPIPEPEWVNHTINIDTGCVFGGKLTALRYPEKEIISVPAKEIYAEPARPIVAQNERELSIQHELDDILDIDDVIGKRVINTRFGRSITVREENAYSALESMSRFAVNPKWLIYLPPTMSPSATSNRDNLLEHPDEALAYFRKQKIEQVVCEEKHMGSRAIAVVCRDKEVVVNRFGIIGEGIGKVYTRTGRAFFNDEALEQRILGLTRDALVRSGLFEELNTNWVCLDCELLPWSMKAQELLKTQYAAVGVSSKVSLQAAVSELARGKERGLDGISDLLSGYQLRLDASPKFAEAYRGYCWNVAGVNDLRLAPFHLLASENAVHADKNHVWHMEMIKKVVDAAEQVLFQTKFRVVDVNDEKQVEETANWWRNHTASGGEGMVVKPLDFLVKNSKGVVQPALKCRGPEYLRIIYGPEYLFPQNLERLRSRGLSTKRSMAMREFILGLEALERFVAYEPLRRVHECVFGVMALESEPVDPRL
ncbi:MAG: polynucleotide kinase-phosphatase [Symploca sp. SIO2E6]|nr:polynucleotide kinase-phosphatase [Symploca sp. SIO2E6]